MPSPRIGLALSALSAHAPAILDFERSGTDVRVRLAGDWLLGDDLPDGAEVADGLTGGGSLAFECDQLGAWDSGLITLLVRWRRHCDEQGVTMELDTLPSGARRLVELAFAVGERAGARRESRRDSLVTMAGKAWLRLLSGGAEMVRFVGLVTQSLGRFFGGRANYRRGDLWVTTQEVGGEALGIVSLISFLVGVILGFVGVIQLQKFGAGIYVADLVAIGVVREMGAIMTGIIMAGRTGAAFAASLGTMKVNEEIDALSTMGIDPIDYLVLPKIIALVLMMPLLALYADALGILGGMAVSMSFLDVSFSQYAAQSVSAVGLKDLFGGLFKAVIYGVLVAIAGCQRGMACGNSAAAVGLSTTSAVVTGIVMIVVSCAIMTVIYTNLGI